MTPSPTNSIPNYDILKSLLDYLEHEELLLVYRLERARRDIAALREHLMGKGMEQ